MFFLHRFIRGLPEKTLLTSVCTGSWIYGEMGLLDGLPATNRKEPDRLEASGAGLIPIDRLAQIAPKAKISRARVVDAGRIITAGGIASGMEMGWPISLSSVSRVNNLLLVLAWRNLRVTFEVQIGSIRKGV